MVDVLWDGGETLRFFPSLRERKKFKIQIYFSIFSAFAAYFIVFYRILPSASPLFA
jgi:hypothetical protein